MSDLYYKRLTMRPGTAVEEDAATIVRRVRGERGLTQEGLARELGVSFATVNGWENGRHRPIPSLLRRLADMARGKPAGTERPAQLRVAPPPGTVELETIVRAAGWPPAAAERRDFLHRIREFPPVVARWRTSLVARVLSDEKLFPAEKLRLVRRERMTDESLEVVRAIVDEGISFLREIARLVALMYGTPDLGNKTDPVDELIYIILARKTREGAYQKAYDALKQRYPRWDDVLDARRADVERLLWSSGLAEKKTASVFGALRALRDRFGSCTLEPVREWPDDRLEEFLCGLPELHRKSAYCVMMYAFGRPVLPVDTHVGRVLARLGPYRELGLDLDGLDHKRLQSVLADLVPPNLRYSLHVNLVMHGREICRAVKPLCTECELRPFCRTYREGEATRVASVDAPTVVDLFAGAGGLSEGFGRAGFRTLLALDVDPQAVKTYRLNHPGVPDELVVCADRAGGSLPLALRSSLSLALWPADPRPHRSARASRGGLMTRPRSCATASDSGGSRPDLRRPDGRDGVAV